MIEIKRPELISPAGDLEKLKIAFLYGADAVYASTPQFSMRTREIGFSAKSLKAGINYAHSVGKKIYLTINTFPHSAEIENLKKHVLDAIKMKPDGLIVADPGVLNFIRNHTDIPIHLSTQANTTNQLSAEFWRGLGVARIVLARELSIKDITLIKNHLDSRLHGNDNNKCKDAGHETNNLTMKPSNNLTIEAFVHGAMCMAYSGRCQISNYLTGRDPNKGVCAQPCRYKYRMYGLEEDSRPGEIFTLYEDETGSHILNSKDLCMVEHIPDLIKAGISSFKLEGRLKSIYYVGAVTRVYRQAIDLYFENPKRYADEKSKFKKELQKVSNRGLTTGFYFQKPNQKANNYKSSRAVSTWGFVGLVKKYDRINQLAEIEVRNYLPLGSRVEIVTPRKIISMKLCCIKKEGLDVGVAHAGNIIQIPVDEFLPSNSFMRCKIG